MHRLLLAPQLRVAGKVSLHELCRWRLVAEDAIETLLTPRIGQASKAAVALIQVEMRCRVVRIDAQRTIEGSYRRLVCSQMQLRQADVEPGFGIVGKPLC